MLYDKSPILFTKRLFKGLSRKVFESYKRIKMDVERTTPICKRGLFSILRNKRLIRNNRFIFCIKLILYLGSKAIRDPEAISQNLNWGR